jgi:nitrate reductase NapE component
MCFYDDPSVIRNRMDFITFNKPLTPRAPESFMNQTQTKKRKKSFKFFLFLFFVFFSCLIHNHSGFPRTSWGLWTPDPSSTLRCHKLQNTNKNKKQKKQKNFFIFLFFCLSLYFMNQSGVFRGPRGGYEPLIPQALSGVMNQT